MQVDEYKLIAVPAPGYSDIRHVKVTHLVDGNRLVAITRWTGRGEKEVFEAVLDSISFESIMLPGLKGAFERKTFWTSNSSIKAIRGEE